MTYNDIAVLESYHVSEAFKLMHKTEYNILENVSTEEYRVIRRRMIDCILATDISSHLKHLTQLKAKLEALNVVEGKNLENFISDSLNKNYESQQIVLNMVIHSADVSNPGKPQGVYQNWVSLVFKEFFNQGDIEKDKLLPVSLLCDRESTNISKSQVGFINFIVKPTFECILLMMPGVQPYMDNVKNNLEYYEVLIKQEEEKREDRKISDSKK